MSKLGIVIEREYMTRVRKKSFIILTILLPVLMVAVVSLPALFAMVKGDDVKQVAVIDNTGKYAPAFIQEVVKTEKAGDKAPCTFVFEKGNPQQFNTEDSPYECVIYITSDLTANTPPPPKGGWGVTIYSREEVPMDVSRYMEDILNNQIRRDKLSQYNIPDIDKIISEAQSKITVKTVKWSDDGESESSSDVAVALGMITAMLIYMFVMMYGAMVMQGVMEEKTNRIIEVIVGSVRPMELMMGKIFGVMLVGLTQMAVWVIMIGAVMAALGVALVPDSIAGGTTASAVADPEISDIMTAFMNMPFVEIIVMFALFFVGGYMLYASFFAATGAAVNSQEDSSQFMTPMILIMIAALYAAMGSIDNTDGPLAFWASLFPLTSPIVMMVRIPFGVPLWQEIISVVILYATALAFIWLGARIYRVGILMYGKKPSVKEILKWIRYK